MSDLAFSSSREPFTAVLVTEPALAAAPVDAVQLAGGRLLCQVSWAEVPATLGKQAGRPLIVVQAEGVNEALLASMLPRIDAIATALDLPVVVAHDWSATDLVAATLFGPTIHALVAPALSDWVTAIALAQGGRQVALHDSWREGEAARLYRLNQEVARIADVLARLTRREGLGPLPALEVEDRRTSFGVEPGAIEGEVEAGDVRRAIRSRRLRDQFFGAGLFEDPAWDMLLDLFAAELENAQVSVSSLCIAAAVAPTTALRWIGKMVDAGLFVREPDPFDRRRAFMVLSARASDAMHSYVAAARRAGLAIA